ncbi:MAG: DUF4430 domain-containing protein [Oscillospiraceae bacterium]|nr:DUF4430 domain-containing protein [Oscillospiraceae bacterium]
MKNKKLLIALIAFVAVVALMVGVWFATRPEAPETTDPTATTETGTSDPDMAKLKFTVIVVHADGTEKTFNYETTGGYLGPILVEEGLIEESDSSGLYNTVDGVTADWNVDQSWWAFYIGDEMAMYGMNDAAIHDGDVFKLVYTK